MSLDYERRTLGYGARDQYADNTGVSEDESEVDEKDRKLKKWFLNEVDKHRKELKVPEKEGIRNKQTNIIILSITKHE